MSARQDPLEGKREYTVQELIALDDVPAGALVKRLGRGSRRHHEMLRLLDAELARYERFRRGVLREERPTLIFAALFHCDIEPGDVIHLKLLKAIGGRSAPQVSITVTSVKRGSKGEWLIEYSLRDDRPLYMHQDSSHGYTRSAELALVPVNVIEPETQERYTAEAWERHAMRKPDIEERLKVVRAEARAKGIDSSRLEASIERRIQAYEKRVRAA